MNNSVLHETIIRDIIDVATDMGDTVDDVKKAMGNAYGNKVGVGSASSIAKASSDLVLVFPFMCDSTVSLDAASMTSKAIERQCVTMLRLLFSACQISSASNAQEFISQFHSNIKTGTMTLDDFIGYMDKYSESGDIEIIDPAKYNAIREELLRMSYEPELPDTINESSLNDVAILERYGNLEVVSESKSSRAKARARRNHNAKKNNSRSSGSSYSDSDIGNAWNWYISTHQATGSSSNTSKPSKPNEKNKGKQSVDVNINVGGQIGATSNGRNVDLDIMHDPEKLALFIKNSIDAERGRMIDSDVKKANELMPSMMTVNFVSKDTKTGRAIPASFVCGVKCRLIPVDPMDIANRVLIKHNDRNVLLSFIRATTRETSFIKDFLLAINTAKIDAMSQSRIGSSNKMWKVLQRRAIKSNWRRAFSHPNDATMITTLGISKELAEYIKKENGIDVEDPRVIRPIMEGYNLMGFVVIDEAAEANKFLWDTGEGFFETISFNNLEREASGGEYKKALNLMQKMYR